MNLHENPPFGRKVFFIEPQDNISSFVIPKLVEREYEIYTIHSISQAKNYLRGNPDSIVFVCVNSSMSISSRFNFIKTFEEEETLSTMLVGVIAYRLSKSERDLFMIHAELPAGYLEMQPTPMAMTEMISNVLEYNGAMGRRKYVRADCAGDRTIYMSYPMGDQTIKFSVENISSVGLAFRCDENLVAHFPENTVMRNCVLMIQSEKIRFDCAVIMVKTDGKKPLIVVLFMKGSLAQSKPSLHRFIARRIQYVMDLKYETLALDDTDYENIVLKKTDQLSGPGLYSPSYADGTAVSDADREILEELKELGDDSVTL